MPLFIVAEPWERCFELFRMQNSPNFLGLYPWTPLGGLTATPQTPQTTTPKNCWIWHWYTTKKYMNYFKTNLNNFKTTLNYYNFQNLQIDYIAFWNLHHLVFNKMECKPSFPSFLFSFFSFLSITIVVTFKPKVNIINKNIKYITILLVENKSKYIDFQITQTWVYRPNIRRRRWRQKLCKRSLHYSLTADINRGLLWVLLRD